MRAARLLPDADSLAVLDVEEPEPSGDEVLVRVVGAGVCRSDIHVLDGAFADMIRRPVTPGHEIAGVVEAIGSDVSDLDVGTPVAVMVGWGCGHCEACVGGHEQLCPSGDEAGATVDGGFAELVLVPHRRHVVPLGDVSPYDATPFGCAALCSYAAVKRVAPFLSGQSTLVILGAGGLGLYATHYARTLTGARVVAVDPRPEARDLALAAGAHDTVPSGTDAASALSELTAGRGAEAVIDFVGTDETLGLAAATVAARGIVALLGLAGGHVAFGFEALAPEASLTTVVAGTVLDLHDVVRLAQRDAFSMPLSPYPLDGINEALSDLRAGRINGRAIVLPGGQPA